MPVAIPIIAGVAAAAGAVAVYAVPLATALSIGMAVASAAMMLTIKTPSFSDYTSTSERQQVLRASAANQVVVYGRIISSGLLSFAAEQAGSQDKGELLHLVVTLAGHKLSRIGKVWLGDDLIGSYGGNAQYEFHNDRQSADPFLLGNCRDWKADMIGKGLAWLRVTLKFDAEKFPSGLPNIKVEQFGREVWDPRDNKTKWSDNAALVILDYYRTILMVPDDELDIDTFAAAANVCDELITLADGTREHRYTINGSFEYTEAPAKILEAMHMACAGQPTYIGGRHSIIVGAYLGPASAEIHPHQIVGNIELLAEPSLSDQINTVTGTYIDPVSFEKADFPAATERAWVEEDGGIEKAEDLDLRFVTSSWQAQRLARIVLHQRRFSTSMTLPLNVSGWQYRPGSLLKLYLPAIGMNGVECRVTDWDFSLTGGVNLSLRQESAAVWADAAGKPMERPDLTDLPSGGMAAPEQLRYEVEQVGETVQGRLSWHNAGLVAENKVIIQKLEPDTAPRTLLTVSVPGQSCPVSGLVMGAYVAQVRAVSYTGQWSAVASVAFAIEAPATPLAIEAEAGNWSLALRPVWYGGAQSTVLCEWWWSHTNVPLAEVESKASSIGVGSFMTLQGLRPDTEYYFWCRAINAYGKSALCAGAARTTFDVASILDVLDGEIGAEHLRDELRRPIELLPQIEGALSRIDQLSAETDSAALGAIGAALAGEQEAARQRLSMARVTTQLQVVSDEQKAMAKKVDTVEASVTTQGKALSAAVQTATETVAQMDGALRAGWYTKAYLNGIGGGFGLSVSMSADGATLTSFVLDVDVFSVLSRAAGETSQRHPFIIKNGLVYMNHALMDTAEIGEVIAKYVKTTALEAVTIRNSVLLGSAAGFGENGPFRGLGSTWNTLITADGAISTNQLNAIGAINIGANAGATGVNVTQQRIDVRDERGVLRVRMGQL